MSFTPRSGRTEDELAEDAAESVGGATEMVGAATMMSGPASDSIAELVGATDMVTMGATDKAHSTVLGGMTPTDQTLIEAGGNTSVGHVATKPASPSIPAGRAGPKRAPSAPLASGSRTAWTKSKQSDPLDEQATRLMTGGDTDLVQATRPGGAHRAATNTVPRARADDTQPNLRLDDTRPRIAVPAAKKTLGGYRITGVLASGQMGVVYRGEHPTHRKVPVAIKSVQSELQTNPAAVARFFAESIVLARVNHPNVVRFHDFGYDAEGSAYLVMELLEGETLTARLARERRLDISIATDIALQITQGLAAAHKQGIVHRDIKPDNIFLCGDGTVKLLDFGVAKLEGQGPTHTLQGDLLGTAAYMAPEQGRSASESDARSDLYSVGCVLFEMLCGVVPFPGSLVETLVAHQTAERAPARALNPDVSAELDAILNRLLSRDPAHRPQTAVEVIKALGALESTVERPVRRPHVLERAYRSLQRPRRSGTLMVGPRWVAMRARIDEVVDRVKQHETLVLRALILVLVLVVVLVLLR